MEKLSNEIEKVALEEAKSAAKQNRSAITASAILAKGALILRQYRFKIKEGTQSFWWAAYSVGQRRAKGYIVNDSRGWRGSSQQETVPIFSHLTNHPTNTLQCATHTAPGKVKA
jgi:hypothetical protein